MRIAYLDEAGVSNPRQEPFLVVSGVLVNSDQHWRALENHIKSLRRRYLSEDERDLTVLHAQEI